MDTKSKFFLTWLEPQHFDLLAEQYAKWSEEYGQTIPIPDPSLASVLVAIDEETNKLAGFVVAQTAVHLEPWYVAEEYQGSGLWRELAEMAQQPFKDKKAAFYTFIPPGRPDLEHMALAQGMKELDWKVYVKSFEEGE